MNGSKPEMQFSFNAVSVDILFAVGASRLSRGVIRT
jgi:hypothetical protein